MYSASKHTPDPDFNLSKATLPAHGAVDANLTAAEKLLLNSKLPHELPAEQLAETWIGYQKTISKLLVRMGRERSVGEPIARMPWISDIESIYARLALIPRLNASLRRGLSEHGLSELPNRLAGECCMMELSAAAGYRTFCLPDLVRGLLKSGKMQNKSVSRMFDTFEFLNTMMSYPAFHPKTIKQLERANELHAHYKVAGAGGEKARDLFKYIALNMFYVGPAMRPDLTPQERHALCGLTVLVAKRMGHTIDATTKELEEFIPRYEIDGMFDRDDKSALRKKAVKIAHASREGLKKIPTVSKERVHGYVPHRVKQILELD